MVAHLKDEQFVYYRLLVYLSAPEEDRAVSREAVTAFMPSPQVLIEIDRNPIFQ